MFIQYKKKYKVQYCYNVYLEDNVCNNNVYSSEL